MKFLSIVLVAAASLMLLGACTTMGSKKDGEKKMAGVAAEMAPMEINHESISKLIQNWPDTSKAAVNSMMTKYGLPAEASRSELVWRNTAPFKRTIVYRDELTHNFPLPHSDVIEQVVDYKVPANKIDELSTFDGSILVDRTRGEISTRNNKEEMNFLSLNLADEIIRGEKSVKKAREEYASSAQAFNMGNTNEYTNSLNFTPASETADADISFEGKTPSRRQSMEAKESKKIKKAQEAIEEEYVP